SQSGSQHWQRFKAENTENRSSSARPRTGCGGSGTGSIWPSEEGISVAKQPEGSPIADGRKFGGSARISVRHNLATTSDLVALPANARHACLSDNEMEQANEITRAQMQESRSILDPCGGDVAV